MDCRNEGAKLELCGAGVPSLVKALEGHTLPYLYKCHQDCRLEFKHLHEMRYWNTAAFC